MYIWNSIESVQKYYHNSNMEKKANKSKKNNILKYLPIVASAAVNFQNPPFSPGRDRKRSDNNLKLKTYAGKGFSRPIVPMVPVEVRRKPRNESYETQEEPTSPKVSCMGQIKLKKKTNRSADDCKSPKPSKAAAARDLERRALAIKRLLSSAKLGGRRSADASIKDAPTTSPCDRAPSLGQMKRFASGRDSLAGFHWKAQVAPDSCCSDKQKRDSDHDDQGEDDYIIQLSAPITVGRGLVDLQPSKEVNLWKRRTANALRPLQLSI